MKTNTQITCINLFVKKTTNFEGINDLDSNVLNGSSKDPQ